MPRKPRSCYLAAWVPPELKGELQDRAKQLGVSLSVVVREYLAEAVRTWPAGTLVGVDRPESEG